MIVLFQICFSAALSVLILFTPLFAAEVVNLKPNFSTSQLTIEFDLIGNKPELTSGVEVFMDIHGTRYTSAMLTVSGDFGSSVPLGKKRRIIWKHIKDFPEGLDKTFKCVVNAVPDRTSTREDELPSEGYRNTFFAVSRQVITEKRTKLMWARSASISAKPMIHSEALKLVGKLNQDRFAGYSDWRIPTQEDFEGLIFFGKKEGWGSGLGRYIADYLTTCGFSDVQSGNYWTSSASPTDGNLVYVANTWNGKIRPLSTAHYYYLWPVRSAQ